MLYKSLLPYWLSSSQLNSTYFRCSKNIYITLKYWNSLLIILNNIKYLTCYSSNIFKKLLWIYIIHCFVLAILVIYLKKKVLRKWKQMPRLFQCLTIKREFLSSYCSLKITFILEALSNDFSWFHHMSISERETRFWSMCYHFPLLSWHFANLNVTTFL